MAEKVGTAFVEIRADLTKLKADMATMKGTVTKSATAMADKFRSAGRIMTIAGAAITAAFGYAVKGSMDLEAKLKRVEIQSGATAKEMAEIKKIALSPEMVKLGKSGAKVAEVFNRLASEGYDVAAMKKMLNPIIETAIVLGTEESETTKLMLNLMQQYNLEAKDMAHISDVLAGALANTTFQGNELVETMKYAGVAASQLGWSLEGTIPIIDAVIKVTGEASMAGTQFRMMVMKLRAPTADMEKEFAKVGITLGEVAEAIKTPIGLIELLNKAQEEGANFAKIFGARAGAAAAVIARQSVPAVIALTEKVSETGFAHESVGEIMDTTAGKFATMGAAMQNIRTTIGDILLPVVAQLAEWIGKLAIKVKEWADANKPLVDILVKVGAAIGVLAAVGGPILMLISVLLKLAPAIMAVKTAFIAVKASLLLISGPVGWIITGIALLYTAWVTNFGGIRDFTDKVIKRLKPTLDWLSDKIDKIKEGLIKLGKWIGIIKEDFATGEEAIATFTKATEKFGDEVASVADQIKEKLGGTIEELKKMADLEVILRPAEEAIQKIIDAMTPYEKKLKAINVKYDEAIERVKIIIKEEDELKATIDRLNEGRVAAITLLDREKTATDALLELKKKFAETMKTIVSRIYAFTHTEYEVKLREINREYEGLIEHAKTLNLTEEELKDTLDKLNEAWGLAVEALDKANESTDEAVDANKELKDSYEDLKEPIKEVTKVVKEAGETAKKAGVLGGEGWDNFTTSIKRATVQLSNFTKEGLAAMIATIKMKFFPILQDLYKSLETAGKYAFLVHGQINNILKEQADQIATAIFGLDAYNEALASIGGTANQVTNAISNIGWGGVEAPPAPTGGGGGWASYQHGTPFVPKTGMAMVHRGEAVVPANQNTYNNSFSPTVNLSVQGGESPNRIAQEVEKVLYDMGGQFKRRGFEIIPGRG